MRGETFDHILTFSIEPLFVMCCQMECNVNLRCSLAAFLSSLYTALVAREL